MISHTKRFIFVHVPKTGGTSVAWALRRHGIFLHDDCYFESVYFKHATASAIKRMLGPEFENYFKFSVVRNPWDWAVSSYAFNRGLHGPLVRNTKYAVGPGVPEWAADWSFKYWLRWWIDTFSPQQSRMLTDEKGAMLVDRVLRFEEIKSQFFGLCLRIRVWPRLLPHVNETSSRLRYPDYYDAETRSWVAKHFAEDIARFGYEFDGITIHNLP